MIYPNHNKKEKEIFKDIDKTQTLVSYPLYHLSARAIPRIEVLVFWHILSSLSIELNSLFPFILARDSVLGRSIKPRAGVLVCFRYL